MPADKKRADLLLVERGFADSRQKAQALLLAGQVLVDEQKVDKPGRMVPAGAEVRILGKMPFVSRAGAKLQAALDHFRIPVAGRICADLGASTGGFTDCLLQNGAASVIAFDVGAGQLAWKLRTDPRVAVRDHCNVRYLTAADLPERVSLVTADLSFISLTKILVPVRDALLGRLAMESRSRNEGVDLILLVKPQFEVGKGEVGKGGIVRDAVKQTAALSGIERFAAEAGYGVIGSLLSPIPGAEGNREFLLNLQLVPVESSYELSDT
jgi:23S rRNA (cytidine1920-2'-O)/16S rRNA (cytidine1409-2'-O)-methyltransferase